MMPRSAVTRPKVSFTFCAGKKGEHGLTTIYRYIFIFLYRWYKQFMARTTARENKIKASTWTFSGIHAACLWWGVFTFFVKWSLHAWSCWNKVFLCLMWKVTCVVGKVPEQEEYCDFIKVITRFVLAPVQINSWSDKCIGIQIHPYFKRSLWNIIELGLDLLV